MPEPGTRFCQFTNDELTQLWDGLTVDDGIRYYPQTDPNDEAYGLALELQAEAALRGLTGRGLERRGWE